MNLTLPRGKKWPTRRAGCARWLLAVAAIATSPLAHAILQGDPGIPEPAISQLTVAILIEDRLHTGQDGRPGYYPTSGVLISPRWVLTVRHGFSKHQGGRYHWAVRFGQREAPGKQMLTVDAQNVVMHPALDLALVRVDGWQPPFGFRSPRLGGPGSVGDKVMLAGFGETKLTPGGDALHTVDEPVSAPSVADSPHHPELFPAAHAPYYMEIDQRDGKGSCRGDSGGPVFRRADGDLELIGIIVGNASFVGHQPCLDYAYAVRLDGVIAWITAVTGQPFNLLSRRFGD
jgi:hypothetical protein